MGRFLFNMSKGSTINELYSTFNMLLQICPFNEINFFLSIKGESI